MRADLPFDEELARRLPLPLAQLYRRAHNAKSPQERHHAAYYLWEAALKLLGSCAVGCYLASGRTPGPELASSLQNLARPSLGHWWDIVQRLTKELAGDDEGFAKVGALLCKTRDDLPRVAGLDAALLRLLEGRAGSRATVQLTELFTRLLRYRNSEYGHGAVGQRQTSHYDDLGRALLAGVPQLLEKLDVLAGRTLVYLADVRRLAGGSWLVERYELRGEAPRRLESLEVTHEEAGRLLPQQVYLLDQTLQSLHPLLAYDFEANEALFLNARRGKQRVEYLSYTTGRAVDRVEPAAQNALLAKLLDMPVGEAKLRQWEERSRAEEGPAPQEPAPLRRIGEFELLSELGRGGMGVVYRAWQPSLGREVALKCLLRTGDPKAEARFSREITALGHVEHPNVVRIFTSGAEGDRWFYAMELVEGATLAAVCERLHGAGSSAGELDLPTWQRVLSTTCEEVRNSEKPLSGQGGGTAKPAGPVSSAGTSAAVQGGRGYVYHVAGLMAQVAEAAHALHEQGVIHRDIKPGNVMVSPDGATATLMDLGLAQVADEEQGRLTKTRQFVGTVRYASPEQVLAVTRLTRASDVYSLGATAWELLTLQPLYGAMDETPVAEVMQKVQIEEPGRVRSANPSVPRDLAAIVEKCLQKDPKRRYQTARELARELRNFLAGRPVKARPVSRVERAWRWARRNPWPAGAAAVALLAILGLAAYWETRPAYLDVRVKPKEATVLLDGKPLELEEGRGIVAWRPGRVTLRASAADHEDHERDVVLVRGEANTVVAEVDLVSRFGYCRVLSEPKLAEVDLLDAKGRVVGSGVTPFASDRLPSGEYRARVRKDGYHTQEVSIGVPLGEQQRTSPAIKLLALEKMTEGMATLAFMRPLMLTPIDFQGEDDPRETLLEALDKMARLYRLTFFIDEEALRDVAPGVDLLAWRIAEQPIPPVKGTLGGALKTILSKVRVPSGLTIIPKMDGNKGTLRITTGAVASKTLFTILHPIGDLINGPDGLSPEKLLDEVGAHIGNQNRFNPNRVEPLDAETHAAILHSAVFACTKQPTSIVECSLSLWAAQPLSLFHQMGLSRFDYRPMPAVRYLPAGQVLYTLLTWSSQEQVVSYLDDLRKAASVRGNEPLAYYILGNTLSRQGKLEGIWLARRSSVTRHAGPVCCNGWFGRIPP